MSIPNPAKSSARRDLGVTVAVTLGFLALFHWLDASKSWDVWVHSYQGSAVDELPFVFAAASLAFAWFAYRRWREYRVSLARAEALNRELAEAKRAEEAARGSRARWGRILEIASDAIITMDEQQCIRTFNQGAETVFGYSGGEILGKPLNTLLPPRFRAVHSGYMETFAEDAAAGKVMSQRPDIMGLRKDGSEFPAEVSISKLSVGGEKTFLAILRDVSERRAAEEVLHKAQGDLLRAQRQAQIGSWRWSVERNELVSCSEEFVGIHGVSLTEVAAHMARQMDQVIHPDDRERVEAAFKRADDEGCDYEIEYRIVRPDGAVRYVREIGEAVLDASGRVVEQTGTIQDITRPKRAEERLRASEERYRTLYNRTPVMLHSIDREGRLLSVSDYWLDHLGYRREEVLGRKTVDFLTDESRRHAVDVVLPGFMQTGHCEDVEYQFVKKSGEVIDVLLSATAETGADGSIERSLAVSVDVTELKKNRTALQGAKEEAELANRAKSEFLTNMSHELRTPLNAVIGFAEILRDQRMGPLGNAQYVDFAGEIDQAGQHLLALIGDLLDLAKIEAGKAELREDVLDLGRVVASSVAMVRERAKAAGLSLEVALPPDLPPLWADARMIKQILLNLLSNAVKFTDPGGHVTLAATLDPQEGVRLTVTDSGIGMAAEEIPQALARFGQIERHIRRGHQGSGLGLPLARSLAELHGGVLEIASEPGHGTAATLLLPAWRVDPAQRAAAPALDKAAIA